MLEIWFSFPGDCVLLPGECSTASLILFRKLKEIHEQNTAHFISIYFAHIKETRIKKKTKKHYTDKHDSFHAPLYLSLLFLNKTFQYMFRLLYDYDAEASQCPTTSTV